jgi:hypothetical protein
MGEARKKNAALQARAAISIVESADLPCQTQGTIAKNTIIAGIWITDYRFWQLQVLEAGIRNE